MEVVVYMNMYARNANKSVFRRMVSCPDAFRYEHFIDVMRSVFGTQIVIEFIVSESNF